jgi:hypothetical protein
MNKKELAIGIIQYEFPEDLSKKIIKKLNKLKSEQWMPSLVGGSGPGHLKTYIRSSEVVDLYNLDDELAKDTRKYLIECVKDYCNLFNIEVFSDEGLGILKYESDDKYEYHVDSGWETYRTVSALIYLNPTEYEGGHTHFKYFDVGVKPDKPSLVLFPSNFSYLHAAMPVTSGKKYIIVTWLNDRPSNIVIHERSNQCPF